MPDLKGTARVLITSVDGNVTHPFRWNDTVNDVRVFGYDHLVQDKGQIPLTNTWIEHSGTRLDNATELASLANPKKQLGNSPDLTLNLAWTQQGGHARV